MKNSTATEEYARAVLALTESLAIKSVIIIGGEPTLWPHLLRINRFCKDRIIQTTIVTNAVRFSDDVFWDRYTQVPNTHVGVSVKGYNKAHLRQVARTDKFDASVIGLKRALSYFKCGVDIVYNSLCADNMVDMVQFAVDCGAKSVSIGPCTPTFNGTWVVANSWLSHGR